MENKDFKHLADKFLFTNKIDLISNFFKDKPLHIFLTFILFLIEKEKYSISEILPIITIMQTQYE